MYYTQMRVYNALMKFYPNKGIQILKRKLNIIYDKIEKFIKKTRILLHLSQMNQHTIKFLIKSIENILLDKNKYILKYLLEHKIILIKI